MAHEALKAMCEKYPDVRFTRQDSYEVGNCHAGTSSFIAEYFPHRRVVRAKELIPYIEDNRQLRMVVIHKLRPLNSETLAALENY